MKRPRFTERLGHSATTAHFQAAYPFVAEGGLDAPGAYIGRDAYGGAWLYDPWSLYERGILAGPNMLVIGGIGYAKSSLIKTYILRQRVFGRQAWVLDPKSEYAPLARALGGRPIALEPGGEVRLNPLSPRGGPAAQLSLLRSVAQAALRRELGPEEDAGLRVALREVGEGAGEREATLPMVVAALLDPGAEMVAGVVGQERRAVRRGKSQRGARPCNGSARATCEGCSTGRPARASTSTRRSSSST